MLAARVTSKPQALRQLKQSLLHISSQEVSVYCYDYWGTNRQIKGCLLPGWSMSSCSVLPCCHLSRPTSMIFSPDSLKKCTAKHCNYPAYSQSNFTATAGLSSFISYGTWAANFKFILWDSHYTTPIFFFDSEFEGHSLPLFCAQRNHKHNVGKRWKKWRLLQVFCIASLNRSVRYWEERLTLTTKQKQICKPVPCVHVLKCCKNSDLHFSWH